jgi:transposase-like protein
MGRTASERRASELGSTRGRWTEEEAHEVLAAWEASGESLTAFGRRVGIVPQRLFWWRKRLAGAAQSFVPVDVTGSGRAAVVVTERGARIEVSAVDSASAEWVTTVVNALGGRRR